jgi:hypothetical protein
MAVASAGWGLYARKAPVADDIITEMAEPPAALTLVEASAPVASASVASEVAVAEPSLVEPPLVAASASQPAPAPKPVVRNSAAAKKVAPEPAPAPDPYSLRRPLRFDVAFRKLCQYRLQVLLLHIFQNDITARNCRRR